MKLYIKNMVCPRCIMAVSQILSEMGVEVVYIRLGEVILKEALDINQSLILKDKLEVIGFELLSDNQSQIVEKIKVLIIETINKQQGNHVVFSEVLSNGLNKEYSQLSKLFSSVESITIEQYIILQRIERAKELLTYGQLSLSEIAYMLGYSSVAHLSLQFKKITGLTPSQFKKQGIMSRKALDNLLTEM